MAPRFCPKCGSIMTMKNEAKKTLAVCPVCGYVEVVERKAAPVSLKPVEVEEATAVKKGIIKDKEARRIVIDEDTVKEALDHLGNSFED